ncbi:MAG: TusE/DsrC/DsvC family sulfur relay protein, partial [Verrucomicrobiota bacterium]
MPTKEIAGTTVDVNEEGYFTNPDQWTEAMAGVLAREEEIDGLTEGHWKVINFLRQDYKEKGVMP